MRLVVLAALAACDWSLHRMQQQPKCGVDTATSLLPGGACNQLPPEGTVPWHADRVVERPEATRELLARGRDRFERFCAPCHGVAGDGDSDVARVMQLRKPPSLIDAKVRSFGDERLFTVITSGYGMMPPYGGALAPADRWAVIELVRVLQHREVPLDELPPALRQEAATWLR